VFVGNLLLLACCYQETMSGAARGIHFRVSAEECTGRNRSAIRSFHEPMDQAANVASGNLEINQEGRTRISGIVVGGRIGRRRR
jgi:hypothetical protein